jgi:transposase
MGRIIKIRLSIPEREELEALVGRPTEEAGLVRRARVILLSDRGVSGREIALRLDLSPEHVSKVRTWFRTGGVGGLVRPRSGRKDHAVPAETVERIVQLAMSPPPAGRSRWTARLLAKEVRLSPGCVSDVLRRNDLKPHRVRTYKVSRDPDFASKVKDVVALRAGRAARHTHDYKRHGVLDLYAALEIATGNVTHRVTESHTATDFLAFMNLVVQRYRRKQLHVVLDNSSSHSTPQVKTWLEAHPRVHFHYTPTSASWLNQVEGFFGILGKQSLSATDFYSKTALREHLRAYMRAWNRNPTPFAWTNPAAAIIKSHRRMLKRISTTVH